jgi:hypothetical protein
MRRLQLGQHTEEELLSHLAAQQAKRVIIRSALGNFFAVSLTSRHGGIASK